jgi:nicotinamidase-related amidase
MHCIDLPEWVIERGRAINDVRRLDVGHTALVVIDMQNVFVAEDGPYASAHARDIIPSVNALVRAAHGTGVPVIWTRQTYTDAGPGAPASWQYDPSIPSVAAGMAALRAGAQGHALHPAMAVGPGDRVIDKFRYGALSCPARALERALDKAGAQMMLIVGVRTNCCCETTAREAFMAGYKVVVVSDATAAMTDAEHNAALMNLRLDFADVKNVDETLGLLRAAA